MDIFCFGAANVDISLQLRDTLVMASSNPVRGRQSTGGVARNVAVTARRLGAEVALCAPVGRDGPGEFLQQDLTDNQIDTTHLFEFAGSRTGTYTAIMDPEGGLVAGFADMAIYEEITEELLAPMLAMAAKAPLWFIDANWPPEVLNYLRREKPSEIAFAADLVSVAKCARLNPILLDLDYLFCNLDEALALSGCSNARDAADHLINQGVGNVIITQATAPCLLATSRGRRFVTPLPAAVRDVTGAGDALVGGLLYGVSRDWDIIEALGFSLGVAALTVESDSTVPEELNEAAVLQRLEKGKK